MRFLESGEAPAQGNLPLPEVAAPKQALPKKPVGEESAAPRSRQKKAEVTPKTKPAKKPKPREAKPNVEDEPDEEAGEEASRRPEREEARRTDRRRARKK